MSTRQSQLAEAHAALSSGRIQAARVIFEALQHQNPSDADALNGLGLCAEASQNQSAAESYYRQAIALDSEQAEFHNNLGILLQSQQRLHEALSSFSESQRLWPHPTTQYNLSVLYTHLGQYSEALKLILELMRQRPESDLLQIQCRHLMTHLQHEPQLLSRLQTWLSPRLFDGIWDLLQGTYYELQGESQTAIQFYRTALRSNPRFFEAQKGLISQLQHQGKHSEALEMARQLHALKGESDSLAELLGNLHKPIVSSQEELLQLRQELIQTLQQALETPHFESPDAALKNHPHSLNFYHYYQGLEDKPLQIQLARLFKRISPPLVFTEAKSAPRQKPRLGMISFHFYNHSVMHLLERALYHLLESGAFESCVFYLHSPPLNKWDNSTEGFKTRADHFVQLPCNLTQACSMIQAFEPDLLIYPDLGMDSFSYMLALNRLAPCQMVLPGHPITTGMPSMDYFISSTVLESPEAEHHYSEQLVLLPGLPDYARPEPPPLAKRSELGLPTAGNLYFCPMTLFKVHPDFDRTLLSILAADPAAQIIFLEYKKKLHLKLQARLQQVFPAPEHQRLHFISWAPRQVFYQRLQACDVILDTFYFGGGNTAYQAFGLNCPIVTLNVPWNKGRWTQAMYRLMGIEGLVAATPEEYARIAVQVATDKQWQSDLRQQIAERKAILFDNSTWSEALLDFCREQAQKMLIAPVEGQLEAKNF